MDSLFLSFGPSTIFNSSLNFEISIFLLLLWILPSFWISSSNLKEVFLAIFSLLGKELSPVLVKLHKWGQLHLMFSLFFLIFSINFMGLFPYIFTASSHLMFSLFLALPLWLGGQLWAWFFHPSSMFSHLVPEGAPMPLGPALVVIESISSIIRPFTLAVRLSANMTAGHLLLVLLGGASNLKLLMVSVIFALLLLGILEISVALIQSYVFTLLSSLYAAEIMFEA